MWRSIVYVVTLGLVSGEPQSNQVVPEEAVQQVKSYHSKSWIQLGEDGQPTVEEKNPANASHVLAVGDQQGTHLAQEAVGEKKIGKRRARKLASMKTQHEVAVAVAKELADRGLRSKK